MVSLTYLPQKQEFKAFIFLLDETEMAQNNSLFVWKTSNYSRGTWLEKWHKPSNKSEITGFYTGKNSKFTGSFSWGCFMRHRLQWFSFYPHMYSIVRFAVDLVTNLVLFVFVAEADDSSAQPYEAHCFHLSSPYLLYWGTVFLILV